MWGPAFAGRRPKNGTNSWAQVCTGPCTYPLGYPPYGKGSKYEFRLYVYRTNRHRTFTTPVNRS